MRSTVGQQEIHTSDVRGRTVVVVVVVVVLIQRLRPQGHAREASLSRLPRPGRGSSRLYTIGHDSRIFQASSRASRPVGGSAEACTVIPFLVSGWTALATSISGAMELT